MRHTRGPWVPELITTGSKFFWRISSASNEIAPMETVICEIDGIDFNVDEPFRYVKEQGDEANARLIAAAPELLHHLMILAEEDSQCANDWVKKKKAARAAIAKARGDA